MDADALRRRLSAGQNTVPPEAIAALATSDAAVDLITAPLVPAAVLVPIIHGPEPGVLLTKRTSHLSAHAGQVAFPGGRIDPGDASVEDAALREAAEEIGLRRRDVEVLGRLPDFVTGTGYLISPVLALLRDGLRLTPSPYEVEAIFTLPMSVLLDPAAPERRHGITRGLAREFWVWPHAEHYIWGATAEILVHLAHRLRLQDDAAA